MKNIINKSNDLPFLVMVVGLPGSGKSTWLENHKEEYNYVIHSSDAIRTEFGDVNDQSKNNDVFKTLHARIKSDLLKGMNVAYDATNLSRKKRMHFLRNELKNIPCYKVCLLFATPFEHCCNNNFTRDRQVPEDVMCRMYKNYDAVWYSDGFDDIHIIWWDYKNIFGIDNYDLARDMKKWQQISHNNPHHENSIGDHMIAAYNHALMILDDKSDDIYIIAASLLHDCGKPDVKSFYDSKGNPTNIAHYYSHESISSYKGLFYLRNMYPDWYDKELLYTSLLINLHMRPHTAWKQSEKAKENDRCLFGDDVYNDILYLYECDLAAH